jgi:asparagine synthase (glutamine-hydrolysing)
MLRKVDRMTMASSIEGRVPFVRREIVEFALALTVEQLRSGYGLKGLLRGAFAPDLPDSLLYRPKHGFNFPIEKWIGHEWKNIVAETFSMNSSLFKMGFIDLKSLRNVKKFIDSREKLHGHTILSFVVLNRWLDSWKNNELLRSF